MLCLLSECPSHYWLLVAVEMGTIPLFKMSNVMKEKDLLQLAAQYQTRSHDKKCKSSQNVITPKLLFQMKNSSQCRSPAAI